MKAVVLVLLVVAPACGDEYALFKLYESAGPVDPCNTLVVGEDETDLVASCNGAAMRYAGKGMWDPIPNRNEAQLGAIYRDWRDGKVYGHTMAPDNQLVRLDGMRWTALDIPYPGQQRPEKILIASDGSAFVTDPLRRFDPVTRVWEPVTPSAGDGELSNGWAITRDDDVYLQHRDGLYLLRAGEKVATLVIDCRDTPRTGATPGPCAGPDGVAGEPMWLQNGARGGVYFQSGSNFGHASLWKISGDTPSLVGHRTSDHYGQFSLAADGDGNVYSVEMVDSGTFFTVHRHDAGDDADEWTDLLDGYSRFAPDLFQLVAGPTNRLIMFGPLSGNQQIYELRPL